MATPFALERTVILVGKPPSYPLYVCGPKTVYESPFLFTPLFARFQLHRELLPSEHEDGLEDKI